MFETQTARTRSDEQNRCRDRTWLSIEDEERFGEENPVHPQEPLKTESESQAGQFQGMIHTGQQVFLPGDQFIGQITKCFLSYNEHLTHLAVRTSRLFGRHKLVPLAVVGEVTPQRVLLTLSRDQFIALPGYQADSTIVEDVDRALWNDMVLRETDYHEIDVQVRDGIITLNGHVISSMNQWRAETAAKNVDGAIGIKSYLIADDKLTSIVSQALGRFEQRGDAQFFARIENGLVLLSGEVSSDELRDQIELNAAKIPWARGVINDISVTGMTKNSGDQRFLQPIIGNDLIFKDGLSATIRKVIINPYNRRVVGVVVFGQFPDALPKEPGSHDLYERGPERLVALPIGLILHLTRSAGFLRISSQETAKYQDFDLSGYTSPDKDWLPPYPYCTDEVLFLAQPDSLFPDGARPGGTHGGEPMDAATEDALQRFDNEGGQPPSISVKR